MYLYGNFTTVRDALQTYSGDTLRMFYLNVNYRNEIDFNEDSLHQASVNVKTLREFSYNLHHYINHAPKESNRSFDFTLISAFENVMNDDFNTSDALKEIFSFVTEINKKMDKGSLSKKEAETAIQQFLTVTNVLGFNFLPSDEVLDQEIEEFIKKRDALKERAKLEQDKERKTQLFKEADQIRSLLFEKGIILEDTPHGTRWKKP